MAINNLPTCFDAINHSPFRISIITSLISAAIWLASRYVWFGLYFYLPKNAFIRVPCCRFHFFLSNVRKRAKLKFIPASRNNVENDDRSFYHILCDYRIDNNKNRRGLGNLTSYQLIPLPLQLAMFNLAIIKHTQNKHALKCSTESTEQRNEIQ